MANRVSTTTQDKIMAYVVDTVLGSNVFATMMLKNAGQWSGEKMKFPVQVVAQTNGGSFSGYDVFSTAAEDTDRNMEYGPKFVRETFSLPLDELTINSVSETQVANLLQRKAKQTALALADRVGTMFYADGTGNSSKDMLGLGAIVDDGTSVATIGGLSRSTFTSLQSTVTASGGTLTLQKVRTLVNAAKSGSVKPTLGVCDETVWSFFDQLLEQKARFTETTAKDARRVSFGFSGIDYQGMPIIADEKATSGVLFVLNENFLKFYGFERFGGEGAQYRPVPYAAKVEGNDFANELPSLGFSHSGFLQPVNAAAIVCHLVLGGNLVTDNPKRHAKLTDITGV